MEHNELETPHVLRCLGRIEGSLKEIVNQQERIYESLNTTVADVQKLKNKHAWFSGALAALGAVVSLLGIDLILERLL